MNQSQFHAKNPLTEAEQRPTTEVFKSAAGQSEGFKSRFASTGNFTSAQLEEGADVDAAGVPEEPEAGVRSMLAAPFYRTHAAYTRWPCVRCAEPDDNRSLYARLKEQKDTKQEEWEHKNSFKNQAWARLFIATPLACPADRQIG